MIEWILEWSRLANKVSKLTQNVLDLSIKAINEVNQSAKICLGTFYRCFSSCQIQSKNFGSKMPQVKNAPGQKYSRWKNAPGQKMTQIKNARCQKNDREIWIVKAVLSKHLLILKTSASDLEPHFRLVIWPCTNFYELLCLYYVIFNNFMPREDRCQ